jgi:flagellar biosynthesis anti-sigma factor FlgM
MKIQNYRSGFDGVGNVQSDAAQPTDSAAAGKKGNAGDRVNLSLGAQLAQSAMGAVEHAAEIRADKVEAAKALLQAGKLGNDAERLADAIVNRLLENNS